MRPALLLPGIATAVSAIDVYLRSGGCGSSGIVCPNLNPNTCCGRDFQDFATVQFRAIPSGWRLNVRAHSVSQCAQLAESRNIVGPSDVCLGSGAGAFYSGGGYSFNGKRETAATEECEKPSRLEFMDGAVYDKIVRGGSGER